MQNITSGYPIRYHDIVNQSTGVPPPRLTAMLSKIPGSWTAKLLNMLKSKSRQTKYTLTQSALIIQHPNCSGEYYEVNNLRRADGDNSTGMMIMLTKSGAEPQIGPMERPVLFANTTNQIIVGDPTGPTCNQCQHYQRHPDPDRGNAGSCQYQPLVLGNHDSCRHLSIPKGYTP